MIQHSLLQALSSKTPRIAEGEQGVKPAAAPANGHAHGEEAQGFAAVMLAQKDMAKGMGSKLPVLPESGKDLPVGGEGLPGEKETLFADDKIDAALPVTLSVTLALAPAIALPAAIPAAAPLAADAAPDQAGGRNSPATLPQSAGLPADAALTADAAIAAATAGTPAIAATRATPAPLATRLAATTGTATPTPDQTPAPAQTPAQNAAPIRAGDLQLLVSKAPVAAQAPTLAPTLAQAITAEEEPARGKSAARISPESLLQASGESAAKFASVAATAAPAIAQAATPLTASPAPAAPAPALAAPAPQNIETLVERLVQARETAQPHSARFTVVNPDFGNVALRFDAGVAGLSVSMTNADPDFAATARMALAERAIAAPEAATRSDLGRGDQSGQQQQSGQSGNNSNNAQSFLQNGAGQQQDRSGNSAQGHADHQGSPRSAGQAVTQTTADTAPHTTDAAANGRGSGLYI